MRPPQMSDPDPLEAFGVPKGQASSELNVTPYLRFDHAEWGRLRMGTPLTLTEEDLLRLRGINEKVSLDEVEEIYLPLSRLLNLYVKATQDLYRARATFLGNQSAKVPYVIGMAGSVAVGKSTTARILRELLAHWPNHPKVDLVTTDGFLFPNRVLQSRNLMNRKGFPESYDLPRLLQFVSDVKAGKPLLEIPVYSHLTYDITPGQTQVVDRPDIVIVEGLNVLQTGDTWSSKSRRSRVFVSDFFDFTVYVDSSEPDVRRWYIERFLTLRNTAFRNPRSYFHRYADLEDAEATARATSIWEEINMPNLQENILPTRERAHLILEKSEDHSIRHVFLRKI
ncbi:MAG: type I pantothenate kinase [Deltaproteobacteria bacterium]|nr:type I pantothenate kinase [Deltaproteobacteria bacterium]